ncbi:FAD-dependent pyridine nucleotide-disulphide oxidoreductase [Thermocrinis albus DSM 14484]|uniref:FAD-dependent pyridine nucleotide-disulphide oxidoreductase n=1 Tax=Thermocrinis albus (strain DSM 14484 / JCM 11386 / HI 11/12) TaxID=638303 RepID=D3SME0_THEAH|nr:FAD-dependent oxidoreductase [Thermocrinis albus]ADC89920.1 FAD-dependent pyridine nucleotide-disulphide oxidoreductase [Thermocrinis albus DSM 14484]
MRVVIVGNGPAAVSAIEAFRSVDTESDIIVLSDEPYPAYAPNCMENVIRGDISEEALFYKGGYGFYEKYRVDFRGGKQVVSIDNKRKVVILKGGEEISYDKCLLAAGASAFIPPIPGKELGGVTTAKNLDDAKRIREWVLSGKVRKAVIIGAGPIGVEDAETLRHMGVEVSVVEVFDRVLPRMLDRYMAEKYMKVLEEEAGIKFYLNHQVVAIHGEDGWVEAVEIQQAGSDRRKFIPADMVILSTGVRPRTYLVENTDIKLHIDEVRGRVVGGILVNQYQQTSDPDVFAAGDICSGLDAWGNHRWIALFPPAVQGGMVAGFNMAGLKVKNPGLVDYNAVKTRLVTAGSGGTFEDAESSLSFEYGNYLVKVFLKEGKVCGYQFVGLPVKKPINPRNKFLKGEIQIKGMGLEASGVLFHHFIRLRYREVTPAVIEAIRKGFLRALGLPAFEVPLFIRE